MWGFYVHPKTAVEMRVSHLRSDVCSSDLDPRRRGGSDRRHHADGLRRAGATAAVDPVAEAPGRQSHVPGRYVAAAAQAEHFGRDTGDLRIFAIAAACDGDRKSVV